MIFLLNGKNGTLNNLLALRHVIVEWPRIEGDSVRLKLYERSEVHTCILGHPLLSYLNRFVFSFFPFFLIYLASFVNFTSLFMKVFISFLN